MVSRLRAWTSACFALMALDYQVPYGPLAYNVIMQFRREEPVLAIDTMPMDVADELPQAVSRRDGLAKAA